ncbi:hypothetical protein G6F23_014706 [Rhizopus arrhizus]|nr:hypothetical protein G6F23_014706 [Rhizopus arrhizus]
MPGCCGARAAAWPSSVAASACAPAIHATRPRRASASGWFGRSCSARRAACSPAAMSPASSSRSASITQATKSLGWRAIACCRCCRCCQADTRLSPPTAGPGRRPGVRG